MFQSCISQIWLRIKYIYIKASASAHTWQVWTYAVESDQITEAETVDLACQVLSEALKMALLVDIHISLLFFSIFIMALTQLNCCWTTDLRWLLQAFLLH